MVMKLAGDGIHDDAPAIQELLDSGLRDVFLPEPKAHYAIGKTLRIHSKQCLGISPQTMLKLLPGSNCLMMANALDDGRCDSDITVAGGIWDMDNVSQAPNPITPPTVKGSNLEPSTPAFKGPCFGKGDRIRRYSADYLGTAIQFGNVRRLNISGLTVKNPVTFGIQLGYVEYFTVEDISLEYLTWNPVRLAMDGIHLDGGCRFGIIRNIKGRAYDDLVALNADDFCSGPLEAIEVDGLFAEQCHSAVRLLSAGSRLDHVAISNIFGTFYAYTIGISKYHRNPEPGDYGNIALSNIFASAAEPPADYWNQKGYPLIWIDGDISMEFLSITNFHRREKTHSRPSIYISKTSRIDDLSVSDSSMRHCLSAAPDFLENHGTIKRLSISHLHLQESQHIAGDGAIESLDIDKNSNIEG